MTQRAKSFLNLGGTAHERNEGGTLCEEVCSPFGDFVGFELPSNTREMVCFEAPNVRQDRLTPWPQARLDLGLSLKLSGLSNGGIGELHPRLWA